MRAANRTVWAIVWNYGDNSGYGILRVYSDETAARTDVTMMEPIASAALKVVSVPMLDEGDADGR